MKTLLKNAVIITVNKQNDRYDNGYMVIADGRIETVGHMSDWEHQSVETPVEQTYDAVVDLDGKWVMPGWINTHGHAGMTLLRGYADDYPLQKWLEQKIWPLEAKFTEDTVRWGTSLAVLEMLKSGTTCFNDMYDHMDAVAEVVERSGMRAVLGRGVIGLASEDVRQQKLDEAVQFSHHWHGKADGRITAMMAPHAPYTCPPAFIKRMAEEAEKLGLPVHIHMSETAKEVRLNEQEYGKRPVEHLADIGLFDRPTLVAHAVHLEEYEMDILREKDVKISHNPASNLKLGSGVAPVPQLLEKGMHLSIGTDSVASNNNLDMFQEVRLAALIHKGVAQDATVVPAETALKMGTAWGAECLFLNDVGELSPGYKADFITIQPQQAHLQPVSDPVSHIIYSASGHDVEDVYVDGRPVVQNGQCTRMDEERIRYEAARAYKQIMHS